MTASGMQMYFGAVVAVGLCRKCAGTATAHGPRHGTGISLTSMRIPITSHSTTRRTDGNYK